MNYTYDELTDACMLKAATLLKHGQAGGVDLFQLTDTLIALELEKREKDEKSDAMLDFNDEIVSIEDVGDRETTDISVSGDNLFFCQGILTKNSFGLAATCDLLWALIITDELKKADQIMIKQLKNRYKDMNYREKFVIGCDRTKMRLFELDNPMAISSAPSGKPANYVAESPFEQGKKANRKEKAFDDFAGTGADEAFNNKILGI